MFNHVPLPLIESPAPKEVIAEASEAHGGHRGSMHCLCRHLRFSSEAAQGHVLFSVVFVPDLVQVCGVE